MNRDKQIKEMAKDILKCSCVGTCLDCEHATVAEDAYACIDVKIAEGLYTAGYRKASEVAEEIFAEIEKFMSPYRYPIIAELKKKYIGKDTNVTTNTEGEGNDYK